MSSETMTEIWGVIWTREEVKPEDEVTWYSAKEEAVAEYNSRGDKYWHCPLVKADVYPHVVVHTAPSPFEHGYDNFYYEETTFADRMAAKSIAAVTHESWKAKQ